MTCACAADINGEVEPADRTIPQWTDHFEAQAGLPRLARLAQGLQDSLTALSEHADAGVDVGGTVRSRRTRSVAFLKL